MGGGNGGISFPSCGQFILEFMTCMSKKIPYLLKAMSPEHGSKCRKYVLNLLYSFPLRKSKLKHYFILLIVTQDWGWGQLSLTTTDKGIVKLFSI